MFPTSLLGAGLDHAPRRRHSPDHFHTFLNGVRHRLLDVNVLSRLDSINGHLFVPVVRTADHHSINFPAFQQLPIVPVKLGALSRDLSGLQETRLIHITHSHHFISRKFFEQLHEVLSATSGADGSNADTIVSSQNFAGGQATPEGQACSNAAGGLF